MNIYVGLSGGVDSSVAALLLKQQGHSVTGVYMKNWTQDLPGVKCPWQQDLADARAVAAALDIPFKIYDFQTEYRSQVVDYMIDEYQSGRTPNPDIMCNQEIKFRLFLDAAMADGADMIATGHYAIIKNGRLYRSVDEKKDQTYFLYRVDAQALGKTLLPIGVFSKAEIRQLASQNHLPTANKKDSQGICFVGPVGIKAFLSQYVLAEPGPIILKGVEIGRHDGAIFYTVGQRQGLGVGGGKPLYVIRKNMDTNTVYVTDNPFDSSLSANHIGLEDIHWVGREPDSKKAYQVRFRHGGALQDCHISEATLSLKGEASALAIGQSAVLYDSRECIGGGIINRVGAFAKNFRELHNV